jgi:hypothetical protein
MVVTKIEIIWDRDHGTENKGFFVRRHFDDGHSEDENPGDSGYSLDDADEDIVMGLIDESEFRGVPIVVKR